LTALVLLVAAALQSAPAAPAALSPEARAALAKSKARYAADSAHAAPFTQIYSPAGFATARRESGTVWIQAPQRLRFDYEAPEKKTFTYDAGEGRFYSPADKQLTVKKLSADERARLPIVFLSDPDELARGYAIAAEPVADGGARIKLTPREKRPELAWLSATLAPDGAVRELSYEDEAGNRTEFRFEAWKREKPRPDADYRVEGPKGTRTVQS
jgi:outer membrane lipoprotein-sorting protein